MNIPAMSISGMSIRPLLAVDLPAVAAIQEASPNAAQWPVKDYLDSLCLVAIEFSAGEGETVIGFAVARQTMPEEAEILNLAVDPRKRRQGAGRMLLKALLQGLSGEVFLEVRASNEAAVGLYGSLGFFPAGRRHSYYSHPKEDAIVLRFQPC